jgi:hypothetical protein
MSQFKDKQSPDFKTAGAALRRLPLEDRDRAYAEGCEANRLAEYNTSLECVRPAGLS